MAIYGHRVHCIKVSVCHGTCFFASPGIFFPVGPPDVLIYSLPFRTIFPGFPVLIASFSWMAAWFLCSKHTEISLLRVEDGDELVFFYMGDAAQDVADAKERIDKATWQEKSKENSPDVWPLNLTFQRLNGDLNLAPIWSLWQDMVKLHSTCEFRSNFLAPRWRRRADDSIMANAPSAQAKRADDRVSPILKSMFHGWVD